MAVNINEERALSLWFRMFTEGQILENTRERIVLVGGYARFFEYDDVTGDPLSILDGYWTNELGQHGLWGFFSISGCPVADHPRDPRHRAADRPPGQAPRRRRVAHGRRVRLRLDPERVLGRGSDLHGGWGRRRGDRHARGAASDGRAQAQGARRGGARATALGAPRASGLSAPSRLAQVAEMLGETSRWGPDPAASRAIPRWHGPRRP
ncbi:MAG: hypothetical protein H6719_32420 [Sandaracinaceae bacterium]|nr:hypothetical protein [Sandaracinaceae bacterium]